MPKSCNLHPRYDSHGYRTPERPHSSKGRYRGRSVHTISSRESISGARIGSSAACHRPQTTLVKTLFLSLLFFLAKARAERELATWGFESDVAFPLLPEGAHLVILAQRSQTHIGTDFVVPERSMLIGTQAGPLDFLDYEHQWIEYKSAWHGLSSKKRIHKESFPCTVNGERITSLTPEGRTLHRGTQVNAKMKAIAETFIANGVKESITTETSSVLSRSGEYHETVKPTTFSSDVEIYARETSLLSPSFLGENVAIHSEKSLFWGDMPREHRIWAKGFFVDASLNLPLGVASVGISTHQGPHAALQSPLVGYDAMMDEDNPIGAKLLGAHAALHSAGRVTQFLTKDNPLQGFHPLSLRFGYYSENLRYQTPSGIQSRVGKATLHSPSITLSGAVQLHVDELDIRTEELRLVSQVLDYSMRYFSASVAWSPGGMVSTSLSLARAKGGSVVTPLIAAAKQTGTIGKITTTTPEVKKRKQALQLSWAPSRNDQASLLLGYQGRRSNYVVALSDILSDVQTLFHETHASKSYILETPTTPEKEPEYVSASPDTRVQEMDRKEGISPIDTELLQFFIDGLSEAPLGDYTGLGIDLFAPEREMAQEAPPHLERASPVEKMPLSEEKSSYKPSFVNGLLKGYAHAIKSIPRGVLTLTRIKKSDEPKSLNPQRILTFFTEDIMEWWKSVDIKKVREELKDPEVQEKIGEMIGSFGTEKLFPKGPKPAQKALETMEESRKSAFTTSSELEGPFIQGWDIGVDRCITDIRSFGSSLPEAITTEHFQQTFWQVSPVETVRSAWKDAVAFGKEVRDMSKAERLEILGEKTGYIACEALALRGVSRVVPKKLIPAAK